MEEIKNWIKDIALAIIIAIVILQFIRPTIVSGISMEPTLHDKNYLILSKQSYTFSEPQRGDIVVLHSSLTSPDGSEKLLIKRIIGLPGDELEISNGIVLINGEPLEENYINEPSSSGEMAPLTIPDNNYFVMGDNRLHSTDSRFSEIGCIPKELILGKAVIRLYPFHEIGFLNH